MTETTARGKEYGKEEKERGKRTDRHNTTRARCLSRLLTLPIAEPTEQVSVAGVFPKHTSTSPRPLTSRWCWRGIREREKGQQ